MSIFEQRAIGGPLTCSATEVLTAVQLFAGYDQDAGFGVWSKPPRIAVFPAGNHQDIADHIARICQQGADYVGWHLNPLPVSFDTLTRYASRNGDHLCRRWFYLDVDPIKRLPEGTEGMATDEERQAAHGCAGRILGALLRCGWPSPVLVDSGNGMHLYWRVDLPNNKHATALLGGLVRRLAELFDAPDGKLDRETHYAQRHARVPGVLVKKGAETPKRPYRMAKILHAPAELHLVSQELLVATLEALGGTEPPPEETEENPDPQLPERTIFRVRASGPSESRLRAYGRAALDREVALLRLTRLGQRQAQLNRSAFRCGRLLGAGMITRAEAEEKLRLAAVEIGLHDDPAVKLRGIENTIRRGLDDGAKHPKKLPEDETPAPRPLSVPATPLQPAPPAANGEQQQKPLTVGADQIETRPVEWLWPARLANRKLNLIAGWGGLGKSMVCADVAARITTGGEVPFGEGEHFPEGSVLYVNSEDDPSDTTVPRLIEAGAKLSLVRFFTADSLVKWVLNDLDLLDRALAEMPEQPRLVIIDPATAHVGGIDEHKNTQLRAILAPLALYAAQRAICILLLTHLNKAGASKNETAAARVIGSIAWTAAVRSALMASKYSGDDTGKTRLITTIKTNNAEEGIGLTYRVTSRSGPLGPARVEWLEKVNLSADDVVREAQRINRPRAIDAAAWLTERFQGGRIGMLPSDDLWQAAKDARISEKALKEAKERLHIRARRHGNGWAWYWPVDVRPPEAAEPFHSNGTVVPQDPPIDDLFGIPQPPPPPDDSPF
jgi:putative DNA primase/helicase